MKTIMLSVSVVMIAIGAAVYAGNTSPKNSACANTTTCSTCTDCQDCCCPICCKK